MYLTDDFLGMICNNIEFYRTVCGILYFFLYGGVYITMILTFF